MTIDGVYVGLILFDRFFQVMGTKAASPFHKSAFLGFYIGKKLEQTLFKIRGVLLGQSSFKIMGTCTYAILRTHFEVTYTKREAFATLS